MNLYNLTSILATFFIVTSLAGGCEQPTDPPDKKEEPYFKPGEYGGEPLEDTEHLYNLQLSPDGSKIALIRSRTPGGVFEPRDQLWIVNADGTDPRLISYNLTSVDWSSNGKELAVTLTNRVAPRTYLFTINLDSLTARQWSGSDDFFFSKATESNPRWFGNSDLLVSVWGKAFKQSYERGLYIFRTSKKEVNGPLVEFSAGGYLGNKGSYIIANKHLEQGKKLSGNFIRYDFSSQNWEWITNFSDDSFNWVEIPRPNPLGIELILAKHLKNAWQLFKMDSAGKNIIQLTELGGSEVSWSKDGRYVYFNRDIHKAPGAQYIPHYYELATGEIAPLWPNLPDSVPQFPPLNTQNPIDFRSIVQDSASVSN